MKTLITASALSLAVMATGCATRISSEPDKTTITGARLYDPAIADGSAGVGLKIFQTTVSKSEAGKNVLISPLSLQIAMAMAANGAEGNTLKELCTLYDITPSELTKLNEHYADIVTTMTGDEDFQLSVANAVFYDPSRVSVKKSYLDDVRTFYIPHEQKLNFNDVPVSTAAINSWAKSKTNGKIDKVLNDIDGSEFMFLVNALYMKADWDLPFAPEMTRDADFSIAEGTKVSVPFMNKDFSTTVYKSAEEKAVILPLAKGNLKLALILPVADDADSYIGKLGYGKLKEIMNASTSQRIMLSVPKLKMASKSEMNDIFKAMGINEPFAENKANFSKITDGNVNISRVLHDIYFNMDEKGVEGAAVTTIGMSVTSMPESFNFNRPFVLAVYHPVKNTYLFLGKISNPKSE